VGKLAERGNHRVDGRVARLALLLAIGVFACGSLAASAQADEPSIESVSASQITSKQATLDATIDPGGLETKYEFWVTYFDCQNTPPGDAECESISVGRRGEGEIPAGSTGYDVSTSLVHLEPGYSYTYWVIAGNTAGKTESAYQKFKALASPVVESESASGLAPNSPTLEAQINPEGQAVRYQFQLVANPSEFASELECPESERGPLSCGIPVSGALPLGYLPASSKGQTVSLDLASTGVTLKVGSTYHYRVVVAPVKPTEDTIEWEGPPAVGPDQEFTVGEDGISPAVDTGPSGTGLSGSGSGDNDSKDQGLNGGKTSSGSTSPGSSGPKWPIYPVPPGHKGHGKHHHPKHRHKHKHRHRKDRRSTAAKRRHHKD
jgi:hypothetical protein